MFEASVEREIKKLPPASRISAGHFAYSGECRFLGNILVDIFTAVFSFVSGEYFSLVAVL